MTHIYPSTILLDRDGEQERQPGILVSDLPAGKLELAAAIDGALIAHMSRTPRHKSPNVVAVNRLAARSPAVMEALRRRSGLAIVHRPVILLRDSAELFFYYRDEPVQMTLTF